MQQQPPPSGSGWQPTPSGGWQQQPPQQQPPGNWQQYPQQQPPPYGGDWQPEPEPPERNWMLIGGIAAAGFFCLLLTAIVICVLTLSSGGNGGDDPTAVSSVGPTVRISQPTAGQQYRVGDLITVQAQAEDTGSGVTRVELLVNNVVVDSQTSINPAGERSLSVLLDYNAAVPIQNLTLAVRAYRGIVRGEDATISITVLEQDGSSSGATATPGSGNNTTNVVPPTAEPFNPTCRARINVDTLNLRRGPSVDYEILGRFALGNEPPVVGRLGDNSWWEVTSSNQRGWVSAAYTSLLGNCGSVPISTPPTSPTPAPTATSAAPQQANLVVSTLAGAQSINLTGGEVVASYILRVKNIGGASAGAFNVTITYPSGQVSDYTIASLDPGQEVEVPNITATFVTPGTYRLAVFLDSSGNIAESSKNDNLAALDIQVVAPTPTPEGG